MAFGARYICNGIPPQVQTNSPTQASSKTTEKVSKYAKDSSYANVPTSRKQPLLQQSVKKPESPPKKNSA